MAVGVERLQKICEGNLRIELVLQQRVRFDREEVNREAFWVGPNSRTKENSSSST